MKRISRIALRNLRVCGFLCVMLLLYFSVSRQWPWLFGTRPVFRSEIPVSIALSVTDWNEMKDIQPTVIDSPPSCTSIVGVMQEARSSSDHKCSNAGTLTFYYRDGQSLQIGILPGHHNNRYEFRYNHTLYSLSRSRFLEALQAGGTDISKIPQI